MIIETIIGGMLIMTPIEMGDDYNEHLQDVGQAKCLADNMYFEARNQGTAGITAVSNVVLNRVKSEMYPNTICEVVRQGPHRESWRKDGTYDFSVKSIPQSYMEDMIAMIHKEIKSTIKKAGAITPDTLMVMEYYTKPKLNAIDKKIDDAGDLLPTFNGDYQYYKNEVKEWKNAIDICINHIRSVSSNRKFRRRYGIKENFAQYYPPYEKL